MLGVFVFFAGSIVSMMAIRVLIAVAPRLQLVDHPGEHKLHDSSTPFVGGIGVYLALLVGMFLAAGAQPASWSYFGAFGAAASVMFATGLTDDIRRMGFRIRFVIQAAAALVMIEVAGVCLEDLGGLLFGVSLPLGVLAVPFTVFGTIGVINALNMLDGIDGLAGSVSFVSLLIIAAATALGGANSHTLICLALLGGVAGFLRFNLRHRKQNRARVFLGDNGSMLLGLVFAWLLIDLTQGESAVFKPVVALWLFAVPLMDTVSVMLRRVWLGKSPFTPDRNHLHHLFQRAGYRVPDVVAIMAALQLLMAVGGVTAQWLGVSEGLMFVTFLAVFACYFYVTVRPWRAVPAMRRMHARIGLTPAASCGVYFGHCAAEDAKGLMNAIAHELGHASGFRIRIFEREPLPGGAAQRYGIVDVRLEDERASAEDIRRYARLIKRRLRAHQGIYVRPIVARDTANDPRGGGRPVDVDSRRLDRRCPSAHTLVMEAAASVDHGDIIDVDINTERPHREAPDAQGVPHVRLHVGGG